MLLSREPYNNISVLIIEWFNNIKIFNIIIMIVINNSNTEFIAFILAVAECCSTISM